LPQAEARRLIRRAWLLALCEGSTLWVLVADRLAIEHKSSGLLIVFASINTVLALAMAIIYQRGIRGKVPARKTRSPSGL
jgi:hypothetical protein